MLNFYKKRYVLVNIFSLFVTFLFLDRLFGIIFGLGYLFLIAIHEFGHFIMAKNLGFTLKSVRIFPFIVTIDFYEDTKKYKKEGAIIAIAGPILELILTLLFLFFYVLTKENSFLALSFIGSIHTLFNLIPLSPLDGEKIVRAININISILGVILVVAISIVSKTPILLLLALFGFIDYYKNSKDSSTDYLHISKRNRNIIIFMYLFLMVSSISISIYLVHLFDIKSIFQHILRL